MADVFQVFAGDVQPSRLMHVADCTHDISASVGIRAIPTIRGDFKTFTCCGDVGHPFIRAYLKAELQHDLSQVGQVLFASGFFLIGGGQRDARNGDAFRAGEESHLFGVPGDCLTDLAGIDLHVRHVHVLEHDRQFEADRAGTDNQHICFRLGRLHDGRILADQPCDASDEAHVDQAARRGLRSGALGGATSWSACASRARSSLAS